MLLFKKGSLHNFLQLNTSCAAGTLQTRWQLPESSTGIQWTFTRRLSQTWEWGDLSCCMIMYLLTSRARTSCKGEHWNVATPCILTWPCSLWLYPIPTWRKASQEEVSSSGQPSKVQFSASGAYIQGGLLISVFTMDWVTGEVCGSRRILLIAEVDFFPG